MELYKYSDFPKEFADEKACLDWLLHYRYPDGIFCQHCKKITKHHFVQSRKSYTCSCGQQIYSTTGTIFFRSPTPLRLWFYTIHRLAQDSTITIKQLQQELGVTYKTAWRMVTLIRKHVLFDE